MSANAGPLREVKVELGVVILIVICIWLVTLGVDAALWLETLCLFAFSSGGGLWIAWRARQRAQQIMATEREHGK